MSLLLANFCTCYQQLQHYCTIAARQRNRRIQNITVCKVGVAVTSRLGMVRFLV